MKVNSSLVNNLYKFFVIVLFFFSLQIMAMEMQGCKKKSNKKSNKKKEVCFGRGSHKIFVENGHYLPSSSISRSKVMCGYCGLIVCRSDRGKAHVCSCHKVDWKVNIKKQDFDKLVFPNKCRYLDCDFEFKGKKSFLKHVETHVHEFEEAYCEDNEENLEKGLVKRKRDRNSEVADKNCDSKIDLESVDSKKDDFNFDSYLEVCALCRFLESGELKRGAKNKLICGFCDKVFSEKNFKQEALPHLKVCTAREDKYSEFIEPAKELIRISQIGVDSKRKKL